MGAYFSYVNAHGGVNGRKINCKYEDDGYNPANTVQITHKFVEQDHAFALVGGLGTEPQTAVRQYLNQQEGAAALRLDGCDDVRPRLREYPWTIGWQPDYEAEGSIYGKYIAKNLPNAKLGVLYQNDDYGNDYLRGLKAGLAQQHTTQIVDAEPYDVSAPKPPPQIAKLKASGADTFVIFATPTPTIQAYVIATKLGWTPGERDHELGLRDRHVPDDRDEERLGRSRTGRSPSTTCSTRRTRSTTRQPGMKLYRQIMAKYDPKGNAERRAQPLRRREGVDDRAGPEGGRART